MKMLNDSKESAKPAIKTLTTFYLIIHVYFYILTNSTRGEKALRNISFAYFQGL